MRASMYMTASLLTYYHLYTVESRDTPDLGDIYIYILVHSTPSESLSLSRCT